MDAVEIAHLNGRIEVVNEITTVLQQAIRQEQSLREFGSQFVQQFCNPLLHESLTHAP